MPLPTPLPTHWLDDVLSGRTPLIKPLHHRFRDNLAAAGTWPLNTHAPTAIRDTLEAIYTRAPETCVWADYHRPGYAPRCLWCGWRRRPLGHLIPPLPTGARPCRTPPSP